MTVLHEEAIQFIPELRCCRRYEMKGNLTDWLYSDTSGRFGDGERGLYIATYVVGSSVAEAQRGALPTTPATFCPRGRHPRDPGCDLV
jgi:hypothetical protein